MLLLVFFSEKINDFSNVIESHKTEYKKMKGENELLQVKVYKIGKQINCYNEGQSVLEIIKEIVKTLKIMKLKLKKYILGFWLEKTKLH